jgi:hypothetical protein
VKQKNQILTETSDATGAIYRTDRTHRTDRSQLTSGARRLLSIALTLLAFSMFVAATPMGATADDKRLEAYWVGKHREVTLEYQDASKEFEEATAAYNKARQRNRLQGERRVELTEARDAAQKRYAAATQAIEAFPDEARRAGASPGWFR